jgi:hypothetical protein
MSNKTNPKVPPFYVPKGDPLCQTCRHKVKEGVTCYESNDKEYDCIWHETEDERIIREGKEQDLFISSIMPERARTLIDAINVIVFQRKLDTGNSRTQHNLGRRSIIMDELEALLRLTKIKNYTDLVVYLTKICKGERI